MRFGSVRVENERPYGWSLCSSAEGKLQESLEDAGTLVVNHSLVLKFLGKLTGFCARTYTECGDSFIEGNWYSPVGKKTRSFLRGAFDQGESHVLCGGRWAHMGPVELYTEHGDPKIFLANAQARIAGFTKPPSTILGMTRKEYRLRTHENPFG